ncbi:MAG TPA: hypothetical protein ENG66_03535 [Thermococcus sp.]|nr:hypothetical protein [Thermococcus sp.]
MPTFRYYFRDLDRFALPRGGYIARRPRGRTWNELRRNGRVSTFRGVLILESRKPIVIRYGDILHTITKDYIDIDIPEEILPEENIHVYLGYRLSIFCSALGMIRSAENRRKRLHQNQLFARVKRSRVVGEEILENYVRAITERITEDSDTLTEFPLFVAITWPHLKRILLYIFRHPYIAIRKAISELSRIIGIKRKGVRSHLREAKSKGYLVEVVYESYPKEAWHILAAKLVSDKEGEYTFTSLRRKLTEYGLTYSQAFDAIVKAEEEGLIEIRRRRYYATRKGRREMRKLPKPKIRKGLKVTRKGRDYIFKR